MKSGKCGRLCISLFLLSPGGKCCKIKKLCDKMWTIKELLTYYSTIYPQVIPKMWINSVWAVNKRWKCSIFNGFLIHNPSGREKNTMDKNETPLLYRRNPKKYFEKNLIFLLTKRENFYIIKKMFNFRLV